MEKLKYLYKELIINRRDRFLGFFKSNELKLLEELLNTDLGISGRIKSGREPRSKRPFIGWYKENELVIFFLTKTSKKYLINLSLCYKIEGECKWIGGLSYLFEDRKRGYVGYPLKDVSFKGKYVFCGRCRDLEFLEELKVVEI